MKGKKILSLALAQALALSLLSGFTTAAENEELNLTDLYASRRNVYLTFDSEPAKDTAVALTDGEGKSIGYTAAVQDGNILRLELEEAKPLETGKVYTVQTGNAKKSFKVKTIKAEDFSDGDYTDTLDYYKVGTTSAIQSPVGIYNGKLFMQQRYLSYFTIKDGLVDKLKNYSVEFDFEAYKDHCAGIIINKTIKNQQFCYGTKTEGADEIGWIYGMMQNWQRYLYQYLRTDASSPLPDATLYESAAKVGGEAMQYRHIPSTNTVTWDGTSIGLSGEATDKTVNYTIDKMGKTGVLQLRNLDENAVVTDVNSSANAAETGYFFIGSTYTGNQSETPDGRGFSLDNILITTCEIIPELTDVYASPKSVYLTFDGAVYEDMEAEVTNSNEQKVTVTTEVCDKNVLKLTPASKFEADKFYTVKYGDKTMAFEIKQLLFEDFEGSDAQLKDALFVHKGASALAGIASVDNNKKAVLTVQGGSFFTLKDGLVNNLKNYTVDFDMETYYNHRAAIAFNRPIKDTILRYGTKTEGIDEIGWIYCAGGDNYLYRYYRDDSGYNGLTNDDGTAYTLPVMSSNQSMFSAFKINDTAVVPATQKITQNDSGELVFTEQATEESKKVAPKAVSYTVDKMGKVGVLSVDDVQKDVYTRENCAETGYFFIGAGNSWGETDVGFTLDNIRVTTCKTKEILPDPNLTDVYASTGNVYLTFDGEPTTDIDVKFTDIESGTAVTFEKTVQDGNVLRLTPASKLTTNKLYSVEAGTVKKTFRVVELLSEDFSDGEYTDSLKFYDRSKSKAQVVDGKLYMLQNGLGYFIINEGVVNTLKSYSVEFDMETYKTHREAIVFNKVSKEHTFHWSTEGDSYHGWVFESEMNETTNNLHRASRSEDQTNFYEATGISETTVKPSTKKLTWDGTNIGIAETNEANPVAPAAVRYGVDKMGKTGVISMDNDVKDVYTNDASEETGYFFIGSAYPENYAEDSMPGDGFSLDNIVVTACEVFTTGVFVSEATATDKDGNVIEEIGGQDTIEGKIKLANMYSVDKPAVVIVAAFDGDTMINSTIAMQDTLPAGGVKTADYSLTGVATAGELRVFVWQGLDSMTPLATTVYDFPNLKKKITFDDDIVIGYLGGSLTEGGATWQNGVNEFFEEKYPEATVTAYNAGIGGTGSDMGAYRYERDILSHEPDIVFIDFAVNDTGKTEAASKEYMENIVRKSLEADHAPYLVFLYTPQAVDKDSTLYTSWKNGVIWKEEIARYYGIKSINIYDYMYADFEAQKEANSALTFSDYLGNSGYYKTDSGEYNVHGGYEKYKEAILKELNESFASCFTKPESRSGYCVSSVINDNYEYIDVSSERLSFSGNWTKYTADNKYSGGNDLHDIAAKDYGYPYFPNGIMQTVENGSSFSFTTKAGATGVMLSHISSTAGASASVYVDNEKKGTFTCYSPYHKMNYTSAWVEVPNDGEEHNVEIKVDGIDSEFTVFRFGAVIERTSK